MIISPRLKLKYQASIIIPTFRRQDRLRLLLESIERQVGLREKVEVIVVDDQSGENLNDLINSFKEKLNIQVMTSRVKERAGARNTGAEAAQGEILIFLDDDMEVKPGFIEGHLNAHEKWPNAVVVGRIDSAGDQNSLWNNYVDQRFDLMKKHVSRNPEDLPFTCMFTGNLSVKKSNFVKIGGFDDRTFGYYGGEDFDFAIRAKTSGLRIVYAEDALALHHEGLVDGKIFMSKSRAAAWGMINLLNKHKQIVLQSPVMSGFPCELPGVYMPNGKVWKEWIKKILRCRPVPEIILWQADLWHIFSKNVGMNLAGIGSRFYYERHLNNAIKKIWQRP